MLYVMIGIIIAVGVINTLICLVSKDIVSAVLSLIAIYPLCWCYRVLFGIIEICGKGNSVLGLITFLFIAVLYTAISLSYAAMTMKAGQIKPYMVFIVIQIFGLIFAV